MESTELSEGTSTRGPDFKALYKKLEMALERIEGIENISAMLSAILEMLVNEFRLELGFESGRIYQRDGDDYVLCCRIGNHRDAKIGIRVPRGYPPHQRTLDEGLIIMRPDDPAFDPEIEGALGVSSTFASIAVGPGNAYVLAFSVLGEIAEEHILYSLTALRHVINLKLAQQQLTSIMEEARTIQESLLPSLPPVFAGYDIDGRSRPTEIVGGDLFDYLPLSGNLLGVAIGDASGHGLPAALLARDVITGLRVGMDEDLKVVRVVERLNRVIHRAALSSKFTSLFYAELGRDGSLIYCNAGHNPGLLCRQGSFFELDRGGLVLGPNKNARYERGHVQLRAGDLLLLYTDGITDLEGPDRVPFGLSGLKDLLLRLDGKDARGTVDAVFEAADAHARGAAQKDDMTVVAVRKL
jgi:phosphoserine phosphatase RsbU/P